MWSPSRAETARLSAMLRQWSASRPWGAWAAVMLLLSLLSGVAVGLHYDDTTAWYSATAIELLVPFGSFFRSLHFYSSQLFFLFTLAHIVSTWQDASRLNHGEWLRLCATVPIILLLLFTGYVLRGDNTGSSAGRIAENLLLSIPIVGSLLNNLLFSLEESGLRKVYLHHVFSFDLLLLLLIWRHLHLFTIRFLRFTLLLCTVTAFCTRIPAPLEPEDLAADYIAGPWFFLGLQELLRFLPPFTAGIAVPLLLCSLLFSIYPGSASPLLLKWRIRLLCLLLAGYALLSVVALGRTVHSS